MQFLFTTWCFISFLLALCIVGNFSGNYSTACFFSGLIQISHANMHHLLHFSFLRLCTERSAAIPEQTRSCGTMTAPPGAASYLWSTGWGHNSVSEFLSYPSLLTHLCSVLFQSQAPQKQHKRFAHTPLHTKRSQTPSWPLQTLPPSSDPSF